jgi:hypothetical protein
MLSIFALGLVLMIGVVQAGAAGSTQVLKFNSPPSQETAIGFNGNSNAFPPVGASIGLHVILQNAVPQFGKPVGATVGRVVIQCTVLIELTAQSGDGICNGIAHIPNGFITIEGNGGFANNAVNYWAITGGVGPYANDRGAIQVTNHKNGTSTAVVTLSS